MEDPEKNSTKVGIMHARVWCDEKVRGRFVAPTPTVDIAAEAEERRKGLMYALAEVTSAPVAKGRPPDLCE